MTAVSEKSIRDSYELYCNEMGLKKETWNSILEFSSVFGFSVITGVMTVDESVEVTPETAQRLQWASGPHAITMIKVMKARKTGTHSLKVRLTKVGHALLFVCHASVMVVRALYK